MRDFICTWPRELFTRPDFLRLRASCLLADNNALLACCDLKPDYGADYDPEITATNAGDLLTVRGLREVVATWKPYASDDGREVIEITASLKEGRFSVYLWVWTKDGCDYALLVDDGAALPKHQGPAILLVLSEWKKHWAELKERIERRRGLPIRKQSAGTFPVFKGGNTAQANKENYKGAKAKKKKG